MPDSRSVDRESRATIRQELLTNLLVEAGAGSGKTQMLADRMAAGIASGVYQVEHMAAVTFTRKAASELRGRFHLALEKRLENADAEESGRLRSALGNLERFFAGTIHSFCARLLRERPVESGVSPGFTELDEIQELQLRKRIWRDFIASTRSEGDPVMMDLLETGVKPNDLDSAFSTICVNEDVEFPPGNGISPEPAAYKPRLEAFWKELQKHLPSDIASDTSCPIQQAALQFRSRLRVDRRRMESPAVMASLLELWNGRSAITQNRWARSRSEQNRLKDLIIPLHERFKEEVVGPYLSQWRQYIYRLSVTLLSRARTHAAAERRRQNTLNYGDLLNLTASVLRTNPQVRAALQLKYRHIFVDEFQDTDPVQAEIMFLLASVEGRRGEPTDWRRLPLRPGSLFVVGDPKQSIYRFRRADIEIYNAVRKRLGDPSVGRVLPLTMNFRSVPELCQWANDVFAGQFPGRPTRYSPQFAALDPGYESATDGGVFTITHACGRGELVQRDADAITTYIRSEVNAGRSYSDFLILTRKKRNIAAYAAALESKNIPAEVSGAGAFGESPEVQALMVLLRAIADPQDSLSLIAVLRGPLFGVSDRELFAFKQDGGWFGFLQDDREASAGAPRRVREALSALRRYYRWTRVLPAAAALDRILEDTGYLALASTTPGGVEAGDLLHAIDRVRQSVEDGGCLADAAEALEDDAEDTNEVESLPLEPGRTDVVRLMNLHKAKGLEAHVVFLADPSGGVKPRVDVHIERQGTKAHGWFQVVRRFEGPRPGKVLGEHADWSAHATAELPYLQAEEHRLLYVAATRARKMLVVSRWNGDPKSAAWGVLNDCLSKARPLPVPASSTTPQPAVLDCSAGAQASAAAARTHAHETVRRQSWSITSATAEARHMARVTPAVNVEPDDPTKVVATGTASHRADAGMAWGTLIHGLLEHAMRHSSSSRDDLRRLAMWLTVDEQQLRPAIEQALDTVERVRRLDFWEIARRSDALVEVPFFVDDGSKRLANGVIDLMFRSPAGWRIVDYKTDVALDDSVYQSQLDAYTNALQRVRCDVAGASLVGVRAPNEPQD